MTVLCGVKHRRLLESVFLVQVDAQLSQHFHHGNSLLFVQALGRCEHEILAELGRVSHVSHIDVVAHHFHGEFVFVACFHAVDECFADALRNHSSGRPYALACICFQYYAHGNHFRRESRQTRHKLGFLLNLLNRGFFCLDWFGLSFIWSILGGN